jgi:uncharacterized protein (TIRG00374 family)
MKRARDPRIWIGFAIAAVFLWFAFRDVDFSEVVRQVASADWLILLGLSLPAYLLAVYLRAARWRYLIGDIVPTATGPLFRATAVGFMANNIFPLRIGEVVRAWHLKHETGGSGSAIFGTVVLERVLDSFVFLAMALVVAAVYGSAALSRSGQGVLVALLGVLALPVAGVVALRAFPEQALALGAFLTRPLPERVRERFQETLRLLTAGIRALRSGHSFFWVALHTLSLWLVVAVIPYVAGIIALGVDVGSPLRILAAAYVTMTLVGIAIAVPSSPGFFGPYHAACWWALALFGVPKAQAVALGTTVHGVFWVSLTLLGLVVLRVQHESLAEIAEIGDEAGDLAREPGSRPPPRS